MALATSDILPFLGDFDILGAMGCRTFPHCHQFFPEGYGIEAFQHDLIHVQGQFDVLGNPPQWWYDVIMEHVSSGAIVTGCGPSNRPILLDSAANKGIDREFWVICLCIWVASVVHFTADTWWFFDVADGTLPVLADVLVETLLALLRSLQHRQCSVLPFFSGGFGGAMANPALTVDSVNAGAVARDWPSMPFEFLMTVRLDFFFGGWVRDAVVTHTIMMRVLYLGILTLIWVIFGQGPSEKMVFTGHFVYCLGMDMDVKVWGVSGIPALVL